MLLALIIGQLLPWLVGCTAIACLSRTNARGRTALVLGYGYVSGSLALTLWMRALSASGIAFGWISIAVPLIATTAIAAWFGRGRIAQAVRLSPRIESDSNQANDVRQAQLAWAWWLLLALTSVHIVLAALEIIWRPLYPWDGWTQWATKAHVWFALERMAPFTEFTTWLQGNSYIDAAPGYPANLPLLQVWSCITLGRWDDSLMNVPSLSFAVALGFGFYGQLRYAGYGRLFSMAGTYAVLSMPFLDTHVALAGYADFPLAVYFCLAAIALWQWSNSHDRAQLVFAVVAAIACPLTKNPGWVWILTLVPACIVTLVPRQGLRIVAGLSVAVIAAIAVLNHSDLTIFSYRLNSMFHPVWEPLWQNYYEFVNWNLLWYLLPVLMVLNYRVLLSQPLIAGTLTVVGGLAFLFFVFSFSNAADWVADYSTVNRATLHLAPLLVFYVFRLAHSAMSGRRVEDEGRGRIAL